MVKVTFCCGLIDIRKAFNAAGILLWCQVLIMIIGIAVATTRDPMRKPNPLLIYSIIQFFSIPGALGFLCYCCKPDSKNVDGFKLMLTVYVVTQMGLMGAMTGLLVP